MPITGKGKNELIGWGFRTNRGSTSVVNFLTTRSIFADNDPTAADMWNDWFFDAVVGGNSYDENITLSSNNDIDITAILSINRIVDLDSNSLISNSNTLNANGIIELNSDSNMLIQSNNQIQGNISIISENSISSLANLELSESLNLETQSDILQGNISEYLKSVVYLSNHNITVEAGQLAELMIDFVNISSMETASQINKLQQIQLELNNEVLFELFLNAYAELGLQANTLLTIDVLSIFNKSFGLQSSSELLFQCSRIFENNTELNINAFISFVATILTYNDNDVLHFNSIITNNLILKSLICNLILNQSIIEEQIASSSTASKEFNYKSRITTEVNDNSNITNNIKLTSKIN